MKKKILMSLIVFVLAVLLFVGCMTGADPAPTPPDPVPVPPIPVTQPGQATFNWTGVQGATFYRLVIDLELLADVRDVTHWEEQIAAPTTTYHFSITQEGTYTWTVQSGNAHGMASAVTGPAFYGEPEVGPTVYDVPQVTITAPVEGAVVETLTPAIEWTAVPGTVTSTESRGYAIDGCSVWVFRDGTPVYPVVSGEVGEHVAGNNWRYAVPVGVLDYGANYTASVFASQTDATEEGTAVVNFSTPDEFLLDLFATSVNNYQTIIATISTINPNLGMVDLYKKRVSDAQWTLVHGNADISTSTPVVVNLDRNNIGTGLWQLRAQASGDTSRYVDKEVNFTELTFTASLGVQVADFTVDDGDTVCGTTTTPATYTLNIDFTELQGYFGDVCWEIELFGGTPGAVSGTSTVADWVTVHSTAVFDTECTKMATLTVTATDLDELNGLTKVDVFGFTLDLKAPMVVIGPFEQNNVATATSLATLTFAASDTKSLDAATILFHVEKGATTTGWEDVRKNWGEEVFVIGTGDNAISGTIEYSDSTLAAATDVNATIVFDVLDNMDLATITVTVEVSDRCDHGMGHATTSDSAEIVYDNAFGGIEMENISFIVDGGDNSWWITMNSTDNTGRATVTLWDADWEAAATLSLIPTWVSIEFATLTGDMLLNKAATIASFATELVFRPCTGYSTKVGLVGILEIEASTPVEGSAEVTLNATDARENKATEFVKTLHIDNQPPEIAYVEGHMAGTGIADDYVIFTFRTADRGQGVQFTGATVTIDNVSETAQWYPFPADPVTGKGIVELDESYQYRIDFVAGSVPLTDNGTVTVTLAATDSHGNYDGNISRSGDVSGQVSDR